MFFKDQSLNLKKISKFFSIPSVGKEQKFDIEERDIKFRSNLLPGLDCLFETAIAMYQYVTKVRLMSFGEESCFF
ncbi:protein DENND6A [Gossypium australe]|uniref:Protein DENND6A n=1 Tax=Gossypium australe TaxID=47621 RepID=A0A5B6W4J8_9ROSI|nr:protein DENND6A [Gossypium australe]